MALAFAELPETRRCYDCGLVKPIAEFAFAKKAKGTRQGRCRPCHARYRRGHYVRNRATYIRQEVARIKRYREENRRHLRGYLRAHPCVDCGESDIVVLEFDHREPAEKSHSVTILATHKSWIRVLAEIAKCDVRCANCHRRRTASQFKWRNRETGAATRRSSVSQDGLFEYAATHAIGERTCSRCGSVKPVSMFPFKDRLRGRRATVCLSCTAIYSRAHYRRNR